MLCGGGHSDSVGVGRVCVYRRAPWCVVARCCRVAAPGAHLVGCTHQLVSTGTASPRSGVSVRAACAARAFAVVHDRRKCSRVAPVGVSLPIACAVVRGKGGVSHPHPETRTSERFVASLPTSQGLPRPKKQYVMLGYPQAQWLLEAASSTGDICLRFPAGNCSANCGLAHWSARAAPLLLALSRRRWPQTMVPALVCIMRRLSIQRVKQSLW